MQWTWADGDQKIEAHLSDIVVCLILAGEFNFRRHRQANYEWEVERLQELREKRRKEKEEVECQDRLQLEREALERIRHLLQEANNWRRARDIRDYVATLQATAAGMASEGDAHKISAWVSWALAEADRIDPLQNEAPEGPSREGMDLSPSPKVPRSACAQEAPGRQPVDKIPCSAPAIPCLGTKNSLF